MRGVMFLSCPGRGAVAAREDRGDPLIRGGVMLLILIGELLPSSRTVSESGSSDAGPGAKTSRQTTGEGDPDGAEPMGPSWN